MYLIGRWRGAAVTLVLIVSLLLTERRAEPYGDTLQVVLPAAAFGCSLATGSGAEYAARYAVMWVGVRTAKVVVPGEIAVRPHGGSAGFPSAHTASATFGASSLVFSCLRDAPLLKVAVVLGAAFTGASRIQVRAHDIWQVLAGAIWAIFIERTLRRPGPLRARLVRALARPWRGRVSR